MSNWGWLAEPSDFTGGAEAAGFWRKPNLRRQATVQEKNGGLLAKCPYPYPSERNIVLFRFEIGVGGFFFCRGGSRA